MRFETHSDLIGTAIVVRRLAEGESIFVKVPENIGKTHFFPITFWKDDNVR